MPRDYCDIRGGYLVKDDIDLNTRMPNNFALTISLLMLKKVVSHQLRKIDQVAIFVCTAGPGISDWSKKLMREGDMMMGYVVDVSGF